MWMTTRSWSGPCASLGFRRREWIVMRKMMRSLRAGMMPTSWRIGHDYQGR